MNNMRERLTTRNIDGRLITVPIMFYAGVTLIGAKDKTPKAYRRGNYYVPVSRKSRNSVIYNSVMPIDKMNYMVQAGKVSQVPQFRG